MSVRWPISWFRVSHAGPVLLAVAMFASGCAVVPSASTHQPMTARPAMPESTRAGTGAIYHPAAGYRPLFEDRRARHVGDTLTIIINEKTAASNKSATSAERTGGIAVTAPVIQGMPGKSFQGLDIQANSSNKTDGKGETSAKNDFIGTVAVTVIEVLPNGNLLVSGEKQIAFSQGTEFIRVSGVVNPNTISGANSVMSSQVADARLEYKANGYVQEAQVMAWLARFFLTVMPF